MKNILRNRMFFALEVDLLVKIVFSVEKLCRSFME